MKCTVVIPVGPGHQAYAERAASSARLSFVDPGPFTELEVVVVPDHEGQLGRSAARNRGMDEHPADWHFLLDADDQMTAYAFTRVDIDYSATFGLVWLDGRMARHNVYPVTRETLVRKGAKGTLSMGCFVRGDLGLRFDESLDAGEDFDFYMRLPDFTKVPWPLVDIGYSKPSAGGPRGYDKIPWLEICNDVIRRHTEAHAT